jgi:hypothetical protein
MKATLALLCVSLLGAASVRIRDTEGRMVNVADASRKPDLIRSVYRIPVVVTRNPAGGRPVILTA